MLTEQMVQEASAELQEKSYQKIQYDTAMKWAARAVAAYRFSVEATSAEDALSAYETGNEYATEAVEHVSAVEDGALLEELAGLLAVEKELAFRDLVPDDLEQEDSSEELEADSSSDEPSAGLDASSEILEEKKDEAQP